jgi:hypothetical protein
MTAPPAGLSGTFIAVAMALQTRQQVKFSPKKNRMPLDRACDREKIVVSEESYNDFMLSN